MSSIRGMRKNKKDEEDNLGTLENAKILLWL